MDVVLAPMIRLDAIQISPEILSLIAGVDEFKGAWRALGTLAPDRLLALRRVATIESIGSSTRIEGCRLSDREVERLLYFATDGPSAKAAVELTRSVWRQCAGYPPLLSLTEG